MLMTLLKLGLLLLSYLGWWEFFRGRCRVNVYFAPVLTVAAQFTALFLPGLLNFLPEAAWALYLLGFGFLTDALRREKLGFLKHYVCFGYAVLFAGLAVMALYFHGKVVTWFDNFTHWATAVKNMLDADRFPTFAQEAVTFTTYPLGSTAMIWYFCNFVGSDEDLWMLAQGFVMLCALLPLFSFGKGKSLPRCLAAAVAATALLLYNIPLTELMVDTLLPLAGTAMLLFIRRECLRQEAPVDIRLALPLLLWVLNIKNAGALFALAGFVFLATGLGKQERSRKTLVWMALLLVAAGWLWDRHCDYVFYQDTVSQHEISVDYFSVRLGEKSLADMGFIALSLLKRMLLRREMAFVLLAVAALVLLTWAAQPERKRKCASLLIFLVVTWAVYAVSLLAMYITSMSREGALELQSADRYIRIWEIMALYLLAVYVISLLGQARREKVTALALAALTAALSVCYYSSDRGLEGPFAYDPQRRLEAEAPIWEYGVEPGYSYLILGEDARFWYEGFLWMYHLDSNRVLQLEVTRESQLEVEKQYDYVVILDKDNPVIRSWVEKTYPDQADKTVIQCFK